MTRYQKIKTFNSIKSIKEELWNKCNSEGNIFVSYKFIKLLEDSQSISLDTGWDPLYFASFNKNDMLACAPCFLKYHSQGEYIFDHACANAYKQLGLEYYPKLLIASPFTPVTGKRLLSINNDNDIYGQDLLNEIIKYSSRKKISSIHVNFLKENDISIFKNNSFLIRSGIQYHFINKNYKNFDDFLSSLSYKKRKNIIKERQSIADKNIEIKVLENKEINKSICQQIYSFYMDTIQKKWSYNYLTEKFFSELPKYLSENLIIIVAKMNKEIIAASLNFISNEFLYGRYWGCKSNIPYLHFEVCYYKAIEYAISKGLKKVEAGAQGEHKIQRGYLPQETFSAHLIFDKKLNSAISEFIKEERKIVLENMNLINKRYSPYKV